MAAMLIAAGVRVRRQHRQRYCRSLTPWRLVVMAG
jgi:hypothetical protein